MGAGIGNTPPPRQRECSVSPRPNTPHHAGGTSRDEARHRRGIYQAPNAKKVKGSVIGMKARRWRQRLTHVIRQDRTLFCSVPNISGQHMEGTFVTAGRAWRWHVTFSHARIRRSVPATVSIYFVLAQQKHHLVVVIRIEEYRHAQIRNM